MTILRVVEVLPLEVLHNRYKKPAKSTSPTKKEPLIKRAVHVRVPT